MKHNNQGFAAMVAVVVLALLAIGIIGYVIMNPEILGEGPESMNETMAEEVQVEDTKMARQTTASIDWSFTEAPEEDGIPYTNVTVDIDGESYEAGKFQGSCAELGASGGVDGKGLLAGELSAAQCWFAGGGNEIGVFANEDGGFDIMVGSLDEGSAEVPGFRGDFEILTTI